MPMNRFLDKPVPWLVLGAVLALMLAFMHAGGARNEWYREHGHDYLLRR